MRLVLVLVLVAALIAALVFVLRSEPVSPPVPVEPPRAESAATDTTSPASAPSLRSAERVESRVVSVHSASVAAPKSVGSALEITVISSESGGLLPGAAVLCTDELGRSKPVESLGSGSWIVRNLGVGEYVVTATDSGSRFALETVVVQADPREQRVDLSLDPAPRVRVFWRTEDDRPFLVALRESGEFPDGIVVHVALDSDARAIGDASPTTRPSTTFSTSEGAIGSMLPYPAWHGAPPDALSELPLEHESLAWVCVSVNGTVAAVARIDASEVRDGWNSVHDVVLRTSIDSLQSLRASVRFCLVDDSTNAPVTNADVMAVLLGRGGVERSQLDANGCAEYTLATAGRFLLRIHAADRADLERDVRLVPGAVVDLGELRLEMPRKLVVRANKEDGTSAVGIDLQLSSLEGVPWAIEKTDEEGLATFLSVGREPCFVRAPNPNFPSRARRVDTLAEGEDIVLEIRVEPGVEIALDYGAQPTLGRFVTVHDSQGCRILTPQVPLSGRVPLRLVPDDYVVEIEGRGDRRTITVDDQSAVYDLR